MANDTQLALAALIVSLVALLATITQALSQLFATADGYRRCQSAIIGDWAKLTRRKFRWAEMRYETIYRTPRIVLGAYGIGVHGKSSSQTNDKRPLRGALATWKKGDLLRADYYALDGTPAMTQATFSSWNNGVLDRHNRIDEGASWVNLLDALHGNSANTQACLDLSLEVLPESGGWEVNSNEDWYTLPHVIAQTHSWDFVPPEVIRPLAVISLQDMAIVARRLGMIWRVFEPSEGILRAEGNGHTLDSTTVRSVGTVAHFSVHVHPTLTRSDLIDHLYVPTNLADRMGFGILPGDKSLGLPDYNIGNIEECIARTSEISRQAGDILRSYAEPNRGWTPGLSDIIGFAAPMLRLRGSTIIRVAKPIQDAGGLTLEKEGLVVFRNRLKDLVIDRETNGGHVSTQVRWVLQQYEELYLQYGKQWEDEKETKGNKTPLSYLDDLHNRHDTTTQYFAKLQHSRGDEEKVGHQVFRYTDLMDSHILHSVDYFGKARQSLDAGKGRETYGLRAHDWVIEGAHVYFDQIPLVAESMKQRGFDDPAVVEEAWLTMMLRAFLWHRTHLMVDGNRVSSQYWGSRLPVYIG